MKNVLLILVFTLSIICVNAQSSVFKHQATADNTFGNVTKIDHPRTNRAASKILFITHDYGRSGPYITSPLGVYFTNDRKWAIFKQDRTDMPKTAKFNVLVKTTSDRGVFVHKATRRSISGHITTIDHPETNGNPSAQLMVTQRWEGVYNSNPIGVYYSGGKWRIYNQNRRAMPQNAQFNILVDHPKSYVHKHVARSGSHITNLNSSETNGKRNAFVFITPHWKGVYNAHATGVWYNGTKWTIYNQDRREMPRNALFNVIAFSNGGGTGGSGSTENRLVIPKSQIEGIANLVLSGLQVRLNNFGPRRRNSRGNVTWQVDNDSYVRLGRRVNRFTIEEYTRGVRDKKYYARDINLRDINAAFEGEQLVLSLKFEEDKSELKGMCSNCKKFREDKGAPDYNLRRNEWKIYLDLVPYGGSVTFNVDRVKFLGSLDGNGIGELFEGIVERRLIPIMKREFETSFNSQRAYVAGEIRQAARAAGYVLSGVREVEVTSSTVVLSE